MLILLEIENGLFNLKFKIKVEIPWEFLLFFRKIQKYAHFQHGCG